MYKHPQGLKLNVPKFLEIIDRTGMTRDELAKHFKYPPKNYSGRNLDRIRYEGGKFQPRDPVHFAAQAEKLTGLPKEDFLISYEQWQAQVKELEIKPDNH